MKKKRVSEMYVGNKKIVVLLFEKIIVSFEFSGDDGASLTPVALKQLVLK